MTAAFEHGPNGMRRNTHLLDWLDDGFMHCQRGSRDWCEEYIKNAAEVIRAQDDHIASLEAALAPFARAEGCHSKDKSFIPDHMEVWRGGAVVLTVGDLRRAARALDGGEGR